MGFCKPSFPSAFCNNGLYMMNYTRRKCHLPFSTLQFSFIRSVIEIKCFLFVLWITSKYDMFLLTNKMWMKCHSRHYYTCFITFIQFECVYQGVFKNTCVLMNIQSNTIVFDLFMIELKWYKISLFLRICKKNYFHYYIEERFL